VVAIVAGPKLDWTAYRTLRPAVTLAIDSGATSSIHIDLSAVTAMEPAGIGALVLLREMAARHRRAIVLDGVNQRFDALLRDCGLDLAATPTDLPPIPERRPS
jgi:anti-anti-sigma factor